MSTQPDVQDDQRVARAIGLKAAVYRHLRDGLARGEHPVWLRAADPRLAGMFPNAFGFDVLCDRLNGEESLQRRRANLLRLLEGSDRAEIVKAVSEAGDEGELEDLSLAVEPSAAPDGVTDPEKDEHKAFIAKLRGDVGLARELRRLFREKGTVRCALLEGKGVNTRPFAQFADLDEPILSLPAAKYLQLRRGEHTHALKLSFELPANELRALFDKGVEGAPPQEGEAYFKLFLDFINAERLPRLAQEARARLKRNAENISLQQAWNQLENALDRGQHDGEVLGGCVLRGQKLMLALLDREGKLVSTVALPTKADDLGARVDEFLGDHKPGLFAIQADSPTRAASQPILEHLRSKGKLRLAPVPVTVVRTLMREVARRPEETHLTHDERQGLLLARLAWNPRAAALHTPHLVRAYIPYRGEVNPRRLEQFEHTYLQQMLLERGLDVNSAERDALKQVPGIDAESVIVERSTAMFRSLSDFQARMGLAPEVWRGAACFLRVRDGDEPLDSRPLHPELYSTVKELAAAKGLGITELLREPAKVNNFDWQPVLEKNDWPKAAIDRVRMTLSRPGRRQRRGPGKSGPATQRLEALEVGSTLRGTISSLLPYGAFVDVGARREGLVHISELADRFVKDPAEVVQVGQEVTVRVVSVDVENQRFRLSMRQPSEEGEKGGKEKAAAGGGRGRDGQGQRGEGRGGESRGGRSMRPKGARPGGRQQGGRGRDGKKGRDKEWVGPDPKASKKEEIDPTNPFFQFFKQNKVATGNDSKEKKSDS